jgi:non-homologous end joining protein Ku
MQRVAQCAQKTCLEILMQAALINLVIYRRSRFVLLRFPNNTMLTLQDSYSIQNPIQETIVGPVMQWSREAKP